MSAVACNGLLIAARVQHAAGASNMTDSERITRQPVLTGRLVRACRRRVGTSVWAAVGATRILEASEAGPGPMSIPNITMQLTEATTPS